jgi:hypothetical protein
MIDLNGHNIALKLVAVIANFKSHTWDWLMPRSHILQIIIINDPTVLDYVGNLINNPAVGEKVTVDPQSIHKSCHVKNKHHYVEPYHHPGGISNVFIQDASNEQCSSDKKSRDVKSHLAFLHVDLVFQSVVKTYIDLLRTRYF